MSKNKNILAIIIDSSALIWSKREIITPSYLEKKFNKKIFLFTTPNVLAEVKYSTTYVLLETIIANITIISPTRDALSIVKQVASKIGLLRDLSETDLSLIALAIDLSKKYQNVILWTEDLKIQNLCVNLGIPIFSRRKKIKFVIMRIKKCKNCGSTYHYHLEACPNCGSPEYKILFKKIKIGDKLDPTKTEYTHDSKRKRSC